MQIIIRGLASGTERKIPLSENEVSENLLNWLRKNEVLMASSCSGKGVCKKCVIQNDWVTCELTVKEFLDREPTGIIEVSYL